GVGHVLYNILDATTIPLVSRRFRWGADSVRGRMPPRHRLRRRAPARPDASVREQNPHPSCARHSRVAGPLSRVGKVLATGTLSPLGEDPVATGTPSPRVEYSSRQAPLHRGWGVRCDRRRLTAG